MTRLPDGLSEFCHPTYRLGLQILGDCALHQMIACTAWAETTSLRLSSLLESSSTLR